MAASIPTGDNSPSSETVRISLSGSRALLLDAAQGRFDPLVQQRIWSVGSDILAAPGICESVPGMNNLLVTYDPLATEPASVRAALLEMWNAAEGTTMAGKTIEVPVLYGGERGEDLADWAAHCGLPIEEAVRRHAAATYSVAAVGGFPGFPYLSGLDPNLARGRRASPRARLRKGDVILGGEQASIMPTDGPSGWHVIGTTEIALFDHRRTPPALLTPGDRLRFVVKGIAL